MSDQLVVLSGVGLYLLLLLVVGIYAGRNIQDSTDFIVAGRRLPIWLCTLTLFATWFGGGTCIGAAGAAYREGFLGVIADPFGAALCLFLAGFFYVRIMRRMRLLTIADFFRRRFGPAAELSGSLCLIPAYIGWVGSQFVAFGFILHTLTGMDTTVAIVLGAVIVLAYTTAGGMWAVTITDFIQGAVLIAGLILLLPIALQHAGGWQAVRAQLPETHFSIVPASSFKDWVWYIEAWLVIGLGSIPGQDLLQRALSARNEWVAQNSSYLAGILYLTIGIIPVLLGLVGAVLLPNIGDPEHILPRMAQQYLHPIGMALFIGALLSALMSSADSALLAPASVMGENIARYIKHDLSNAAVLKISRWAVPVFGALSLLIALYFKNVYDLMVNSWAVLLVSLFVPLTAGIYWRRANGPAAVASLIVGMLSWIILAKVQDAYPADLLALGLAALTLTAVTLATSRRISPLPLTDFDGRPVAYADRLGLLRPFPRKK